MIARRTSNPLARYGLPQDRKANAKARAVQAFAADGGPVRYRVRHEVPLWRAGEPPQLRTSVVEGDAGLSV